MKIFNDLGYKILWGLGVTGTLAAPVTTGYVIARNLIEVKEFDWRFALTAALAVETMGFTAATVGLAHYDQDNRTGQRYGSLQTWLSVVALVVYVAVAITLTYVIENDLTLALFPLLSLVGSMILALVQELKRRTAATSDDQARRELEWQAQERREAQQMQLEAAQQAERDRLLAERQARLDQLAHEEKLAEITARKEAKVAKLQAKAVTADVKGDKETVTPAITSNERRATLHSLIMKGDRPNVTELAKTWGVSRKTVYGDIAYVTSDGNGYHQEQGG